MEHILPKSLFSRCLRIEKRRADRSRSPFSVALFSFNRDWLEQPGSFDHFLAKLQKDTRETDIKGWVDHDRIGLILPDTDGPGVKSCVDKIVNGNGGRHLSVVIGTYPDRIVQSLFSREQDDPDFFPLDVDETARPGGLQSRLKRILDVIGSVAGLLLFSPLMIAASIAIKMDSPGPVIFKQMRVGRKGSRFSFYKFRSMVLNGDDRIHREYVETLIKGDLDRINQGDGTAPLYKMKSDPRVTFVGRVIRKTSIDELPQFINVLKGEMSLVGPRPPLLYEVEKYKPWHLRRILEIKPGITGLWQVDGRSSTSFDDMVRLDLRYAGEWSLWLDFKILLKTVRAVLRPRGAV